MSGSFYDIAMTNSQKEKKRRKRRDNANIPSSPVESSEDDLEWDLVPGCIAPRQNRLTHSQKKIMNEKTKEINSENHINGYVINKNNVEFSRKYADLYLPFEDETLVFQRRGKTWNVRCCITKKNSRRILKGWAQFARDNDLFVGDICLFELLVNNKKYVMKVHIIRKK
uniref:TF-B3 domain-containing protein n=1 Tax=Leersia perrieri TaxID=77586 RepID=A0A0D9VU83_9ORYZ